MEKFGSKDMEFAKTNEPLLLAEQPPASRGYYQICYARFANKTNIQRAKTRCGYDKSKVCLDPPPKRIVADHQEQQLSLLLC